MIIAYWHTNVFCLFRVISIAETWRDCTCQNLQSKVLAVTRVTEALQTYKFATVFSALPALMNYNSFSPHLLVQFSFLGLRFYAILSFPLCDSVLWIRWMYVVFCQPLSRLQVVEKLGNRGLFILRTYGFKRSICCLSKVWGLRVCTYTKKFTIDSLKFGSYKMILAKSLGKNKSKLQFCWIFRD